MTTSKKDYKLCSLLFKSTTDYEQNLQTLLDLISKTDKNTLIVAPEVCLTTYDYDNFEAMLDFVPYAVQKIKEASKDKIIILTMVERTKDGIFNFAKIFHNEEVVFQRAKARLFKFGDEHNYMQEGSDEDFKIVEVDGIKIAIFVCFEMRFKELWQKSEGADVIAAPSYWGVLRSEHFKIVTNALALINQCYVVASDSQNEDCTALSGIIDPYGKETRNENKSILEVEFDRKNIKTMRKYMDVGIG